MITISLDRVVLPFRAVHKRRGSSITRKTQLAKGHVQYMYVVLVYWGIKPLARMPSREMTLNEPRSLTASHTPPDKNRADEACSPSCQRRRHAS